MPVTPLILMAAGAVAVYTDLKYRIIPNRLTLPLMVSGLVWHAAVGGWSGLGQAFQGLTLGFFLLIIPFLMGGMGGGDLKFLMAVGACGGPLLATRVFVFSCTAGALIALVILIKEGLFIKTIINVLRTIWFFVVSLGRIRVPAATSGGSIPYAVCLFIGTILGLILDKGGI